MERLMAMDCLDPRATQLVLKENSARPSTSGRTDNDSYVINNIISCC